MIGILEEKKEEAPKPAGGFSFGGFSANKPGKLCGFWRRKTSNIALM